MDHKEAVRSNSKKETHNTAPYRPIQNTSKTGFDHDQLSHILHKTSLGLLKDHDWNEQIQDLLHDIGHLLNVSRVYIAKNVHSALETAVQRTLEWNDVTTSPVAANEHWEKLANAHDNFQSWRMDLAQGKPFYAHIDQLPNNEQTLFAQIGVQSFALIPLSAKNSWWGMLGIEECRERHEWNPDEIYALSKTAEFIEASLEGRQQQSDKKYTEARQHFETLSHATDEMLYERHVNGDYIWCSENIKKLLGYREDSTSDYAAWWLANIHPDDWQIVSGSSVECIKQKRPTWSMHYRFRHADGYYVKVHDRAYITYNDHDSTRITGTMRIISKNENPTTHNNYLHSKMAEPIINTSCSTYTNDIVTTVLNINSDKKSVI